VVFPCIPAFAERFALKLSTAWSAFGRPFTAAETAELRRALASAMREGQAAASSSLIVVSYEAQPLPSTQVRYRIAIRPQTPDRQYELWKAHRTEALFGAHADAKLLSLVATLGEPSECPVLDVGAGAGRNALELARRGHCVDAVELVPGLCEEMREASEAKSLPVRVIQGDFLSPEVTLRDKHYRVIVLSEVATQLDERQVERAFSKLSAALAPGGFLLLNVFVTADGYRPDSAAREFSLFSLCVMWTRSELQRLAGGLPLRLVSDESAFEYERAHLPPEAWPPTSWFASWAQGQNIFDLPEGRAPVELRWLLYQRDKDESC
jgi:SAM-dependent methyltransferase